jgi:hypothetical protein
LPTFFKPKVHGLAWGIRSDQDRDDRLIMTLAVEVLKIESVIPHLLDSVGGKSVRAHFELNDYDEIADDQDRVNTLPNPWHVEFKEKTSVKIKIHQSLLEEFALRNPRVALKQANLELAVLKQLAEELARVASQEIGD